MIFTDTHFKQMFYELNVNFKTISNDFFTFTSLKYDWGQYKT